MTTAFPSAPATLVHGDVVHARLRPKRHRLRYRVFSLLIDLDRTDAATRTCKIFSHNRFNWLSLRDADHLTPHRDGLAAAARAIFSQAGISTANARVFLLAYPRMLGFAFNPLSVFYLVSVDDSVRAVIYEVRNTFGERKCYVTAAGDPAGDVYAHGFAKELFVSPFAPGDGRYDFRLSVDHERLAVGVAFRDAEGPLIRTHFTGVYQPLTTAAALAALARLPLMTLKVVAGIHWEALKLWVKGVPLTRRHRSPRYSVSTVDARPHVVTGDHVGS